MSELLAEFSTDGGVQIWGEGLIEEERVDVRRRHELEPAKTLVVWSAPPGVEVLRRALQRVDPERVALFNAASGLDSAKALLSHMLSLVKYAMRTKGGRVEPPLLAASTGHQELIARLALTWLEAKGAVSVVDEGGLALQLGPGGVEEPDLARATITNLKAALRETIAYRRHYAHAAADNLVNLDRSSQK